MSAKAAMRRNKTSIHRILSGDHKFVLNKVYENKLITEREYHNLKGIFKENVEGHVVELVDTIMEKGEDTCERFLRLLETDDEIKDTFPNLKTVQLSSRRQPTGLIHETCLMDNKDDEAPRAKKTKMDESYPVTSYPTGLCLILNNMNFEDGSTRRGTDKDAESLAEVFNWLGFRVLMCEDQTMLAMSSTLKCFSTLGDISELQQFSLKEWTTVGFVNLQQTLEHGDVFICCILTHGNKGIVYGTDKQPLSIKDITRTFRATDSSPLTAKPKVFLIQACQGVRNVQRGVIKRDLETDGESSVSVPEEADVLVAVATVEDYVSFRNTVNGSWFIQSLCQQLKEGCSRGDDIHSILQRVNSEVSQKEGNLDKPGQIKQMPEVHYTLTKKLILSGYHC
ncbi:caspase-8-like [Periophthalmus magnuspinnatus]|uniref:caspase-8-like n=1 Tax=Periophthalmus magnuspinnatus TaxID=409849 RepID=UPI00145ABE63|nr:caspase-8-like [Periophthalmus magnuspinnatus]